jgi:Tfp pilus assembly protein PilF
VDFTRAGAISSTRRARAADPLLVDAVTNQAFAYQWRGDDRRAYRLYVRATEMQPDNPDTWRFLGEFLLRYGCPRLAYPALQRYTDLDDHNQSWLGASDKDTALKYVNSGKADPARCGG